MITPHTQGPWHVNNDLSIHGCRLVYGPDGYLVADAGRIPKREMDETIANARLIASAPDLHRFAAAIARMTQDQEEVDGEEFDMTSDDAVETLNSLISEARELIARTRVEPPQTLADLDMRDHYLAAQRKS